MKAPHRILFIGNSYTYYNELWDRVAELATLVGIDAQVDHVTKGGAILAQMLDPSEACGAEVLQKLTTERYDTVVLQDHSLRTVLDPEGFAADVADLHAMIEQNGAKTLLYQTWSRHPSSAKLTELGLTHESMTRTIAEQYASVGRAIGAGIALVGEAFYDVVCNHPEIDLYDPDGSHPSPAGTALAALCIAAILFGRSPSDILYTYGTENEAQAKALASAADAAIGG